MTSKNLRNHIITWARKKAQEAVQDKNLKEQLDTLWNDYCQYRTHNLTHLAGIALDDIAAIEKVMDRRRAERAHRRRAALRGMVKRLALRQRHPRAS